MRMIIIAMMMLGAASTAPLKVIIMKLMIMIITLSVLLIMLLLLLLVRLVMRMIMVIIAIGSKICHNKHGNLKKKRFVSFFSHVRPSPFCVTVNQEPRSSRSSSRSLHGYDSPNRANKEQHCQVTGGQRWRFRNLYGTGLQGPVPLFSWKAKNRRNWQTLGIIVYRKWDRCVKVMRFATTFNKMCEYAMPG